MELYVDDLPNPPSPESLVSGEPAAREAALRARRAGKANVGEASTGKAGFAEAGPPEHGPTEAGASKKRQAPPARSIEQEAATSRWGTRLSFLVPDAAAFALLWLLLGPIASRFESVTWTGGQLWPLLCLLVCSFAVAGLYHRALTMHPVQELRSSGLLTVVIFFAYTVTLGLTGAIGFGEAGGLATAGGLAAILVPFARALSRILFARVSWWGAPVLVLASGKTGREVVRNLRRWPEIGLRPVAVVQASRMTYAASDGPALGYSGDGAPTRGGDRTSQAVTSIDGVPVIYDTALAPNLISTYGIPYTIVSRPDLQHSSLNGLLRRCSRFCRQVFVVTDSAGASALWTGQQAFHGFSGYGVRHVEFSQLAQLGKRLFDLAGALAILALTAPFLLLIAALTKLDSTGPVFYRQLRIGRKGRCFSVLKFRTMHVDAEERLEGLLEENPALRAEYNIFHKLQNDPRVTRLGRVLRKLSLDELPQLWNVLKGDMSLMGPRPYTPGELSRMQGLEHVIVQCRPGVSGLWQVSGRNALSFEERTRMDVHYVHHWSLWLDLYILARTLPAVFEKENTA